MFSGTFRISGRIASQRRNNCVRTTYPYHSHNNLNSCFVNDYRHIAGAYGLCNGVVRQQNSSECVYFESKRPYNSWPPQNRIHLAMQEPSSSTARPNDARLAHSDRGFATHGESVHTNRLIDEKSPYLLQHAHNPVDWYPWGDEAIAKAKAENKVIFLSVGYSTCHWCHVMEKESFESPAVAEVMNRHFVSIKVDREERPDIDKIYMQFVLLLNGSGGWPMSVWLTPDLTPITAGTYFPPTDRWGMSGFTTILEKIADLWRTQPDKLVSSGKKIVDIMGQHANDGQGRDPGQASHSDDASVDDRFDEVANVYERNIDEVWGGFGAQTKFPEVAKLNLAFHAHIHRPEANLARLSLLTLRNIANGGIHDHVFGGFCRYAVDRQWHVPHFEKMLYDQGQLLTAYTNAYKLGRDALFLDTADKIYAYLMQDLRHPMGGFFCGEDADSLRQFDDTEKIEGAFYAWTFGEVRDILEQGADQFAALAAKSFDIYCHYYGINESGNVAPTSDPHGHLLERNILRIRTTVHETARQFGVSADDVTKVVTIGNGLLHTERCKRPRPQLDTKIVTAWNGLVLSGLSNLSTIHGTANREQYVQTARELINFLKSHAYDPDAKTLIRSCYGESSQSETLTVLEQPVGGFLDDYAFLIRGLIDFYMATLDIDVLLWAKELQDTQDRLFWDSDRGGYFYSQESSPNYIIRLKEDHDGAEPCGNSVSAWNLLFLSAYFQQRAYKDRVRQLLDFFQSKALFGYVLPEMFSAQLMIVDSLTMMIVVGPKSDKVDRMFDIARDLYIPGLILLHHDPDNPNQTVIRESITKFKMVRNEPTVYLCHNRECQLPITSQAELEQTLKRKYLPAVLQG